MAERRPEAWWHPLRSDPAIAEGLTIWAHLLAIGIALVGTVVLGFAIGTSATAIAWLSDEIAGVFSAIGIVLIFTVLFSWAGHLPGAVVLHYALVRGKGGWAVAMAGGLVIGVALSALIGSGLAALLGPFLALGHLVALRWMASLFRPRRDRIAPSGRGEPQ